MRAFPTDIPAPSSSQPCATPKSDNGVEFLSPADAARYLSVSAKQLENWRRAGNGGPPFHKFSRRLVRYRRSELLAWADEHRRNSTAEAHAAEGGGR